MGFLFRILYTLTSFVETLIVFRIVLKIVNANASHSFVGWVFDTSEILISPFRGILSNEICLDKFCIELTPIVALVFFSIVGFVLSELSKSFKKTE